MPVIKLDLNPNVLHNPYSLIHTQAILLGNLAYPQNESKIQTVELCLKRLRGIRMRALTSRRIPSKSKARRFLLRTAEILMKERTSAALLFSNAFGFEMKNGKPDGVSKHADAVCEVRNLTERSLPLRGTPKANLSKKDLITKIWAPTKPVLPLALAVNNYLSNIDGTVKDPMNLVNLISWIPETVAAAEWYRTQIETMVRLYKPKTSYEAGLRIDLNKLIRFIPSHFSLNTCSVNFLGIPVPLFTDIFPNINWRKLIIYFQ